MKELSAEYGKKITVKAMADDEAWLLTIEGVIKADVPTQEELLAG